MLVGFANVHLAEDGVALFPKGSNWEAEDVDARNVWQYTCDPIPSETDPSAAVLRIKEISHV
jgi:16S rRNA (guanine527-N7)-methyltransferase